MIGPAEIRQKALNLYPTWQLAWLSDEPFFPKVLRCEKTLEDNLGAASESIRRLRAGSKQELGYGYTVDWKERNSRRHGRNLFPERILFETEHDFLRLIGKQAEFAAFAAAVREIRERLPPVTPWIRAHRQELVDAVGDLEGLLTVVEYFRQHPRPQCFARELPIPVDTKFIERNQRMLRAWLDLVLPPQTIRADEEHFDRRFGLRYLEPLILVRILEDDLRQQAEWPWHECAIPLQTLAEHPIVCTNVVIVENKTNLLTLPQIAGTIALGGLGNAVTDLRFLTWLADRELWYWGDLDVEGFEILSRLRAYFPRIRSLLMDETTIDNWRKEIGQSGTGRQATVPPGLTTTERKAFEICRQDNLRMEQEHIRQGQVLQALFGCGLTPSPDQ